MEQLTYKGKIFTRKKGKWYDSNNIAVYEGMQMDLNREYARNLDPYKMSLDDCIKQGDQFKKSGSNVLALKFFEAAVERADHKSMLYIFPRISSCYRAIGQPQKAIDVLTQAIKTFGESIITPVLLTSVAAAYCDLEDYNRAKKCCDRAYAKLNGKPDKDLSSVYSRIKAATEK